MIRCTTMPWLANQSIARPKKAMQLWAVSSSRLDPVAGPGELAQLLDVDVDELAGMATAVTVRWLGGLEARQPVEAESGQHGAHRRGGQMQLGGDPSRGPAQAPQLLDPRLELCGGPARHPVRSRGSIQHRIPSVVAGQPAITGPFRAAGRLGGVLDRPTFDADALAHQHPAAGR